MILAFFKYHYIHDKETCLIFLNCCTWSALVQTHWSWFNHFFIDGYLGCWQVSAINISVSILSTYPCARIPLPIYPCGVVGWRFAFELFIDASSCPAKKLSRSVLQPAGTEARFPYILNNTGFSVFRNFANPTRKQWKHQIAVSGVSREVFSCASCFRSMFMRRDRTCLLAQTARDLCSRKMKHVL